MTFATQTNVTKTKSMNVVSLEEARWGLVGLMLCALKSSFLQKNTRNLWIMTDPNTIVSIRIDNEVLAS